MSDIITTPEGKRFRKTGEREIIKAGHTYLCSCCTPRRPYIANFSSEHGTGEILVELPAEPAPAMQHGEAIQNCSSVNPSLIAVNRDEQSRGPGDTGHNAAIAIKELARNLKELPPISGDYESAISEALAPLLEKARARCEVDKTIFYNAHPRAGLGALPATLAELDLELNRWQEGEKK